MGCILQPRGPRGDVESGDELLSHGLSRSSSLCRLTRRQHDERRPAREHTRCQSCFGGPELSHKFFPETSEVLSFLTSFSQKLDEATDADTLHASIIEAFAHITYSPSIALWSVNVRRMVYQRRACIGSDCRSLPDTLAASPACTANA